MRHLACLLVLASAAMADGGSLDKRARELYTEYLEKQLPGFAVETFQQVPLTAAELAEVAKNHTVFQAETTRVNGSYHRHTVLYFQPPPSFDRAPGIDVWEECDHVSVLRRVLGIAGIKGADEASVRKAGLICMLLPAPFEYDKDRIEIGDRTFVYHEHRLTLLSGRVGTYVEDRIVTFDKEGVLSSMETTGEPDLTTHMDTYRKLITDPDPWLQLDGFVPDKLKARVEAKKSQRKTPIRHDSK